MTEPVYNWQEDPGAVEDFGGPAPLPVHEEIIRRRAMFDALPNQREQP